MSTDDDRANWQAIKFSLLSKRRDNVLYLFALTFRLGRVTTVPLTLLPPCSYRVASVELAHIPENGGNTLAARAKVRQLEGKWFLVGRAAADSPKYTARRRRAKPSASLLSGPLLWEQQFIAWVCSTVSFRYNECIHVCVLNIQILYMYVYEIVYLTKAGIWNGGKFYVFSLASRLHYANRTQHFGRCLLWHSFFPTASIYCRRAHFAANASNKTCTCMHSVVYVANRHANRFLSFLPALSFFISSCHCCLLLLLLFIIAYFCLCTLCSLQIRVSPFMSGDCWQLCSPIAPFFAVATFRVGGCVFSLIIHPWRGEIGRRYWGTSRLTCQFKSENYSVLFSTQNVCVCKARFATGLPLSCRSSQHKSARRRFMSRIYRAEHLSTRS